MEATEVHISSYVWRSVISARNLLKMESGGRLVMGKKLKFGMITGYPHKLASIPLVQLKT